MKKLPKTVCCNVSLLILPLLLVGCTSGTNEELETDPSKNAPAIASEAVTNETEESNLIDEGDESESTTGSVESLADDSNGTSSEETKNDELNNTSGSENDHELSEYYSEEIEYARVWLKLGENQEPDELNVIHIPAGEPMNSDDDTSAEYPEDVIQLAGSRLVDGSVTYSSNGDGTINVYNVPLRWDGRYPAGEQFYADIIENTKQVYVDPGDDEEIIALIKLLNVHE